MLVQLLYSICLEMVIHGSSTRGTSTVALFGGAEGSRMSSRCSQKQTAAPMMAA